jgi:hypothetical protein
MRFNKKLLTFSLCLCLLESTQSFAASSSAKTDADMERALSKVTAQTEQLQEEIQSLKAELNAVKRQRTGATRVAVSHTTITPRHQQAGRIQPPLVVGGPNVVTTASGVPSGYRQGDLLAPDVAVTHDGHPILTVGEEIKQGQNLDVTYLIGSYVMTSQVLNIHSAYDASDLLVNQSTMNEDLRFLQQRQTLESLVGVENLPSVDRPTVFLSGKVEPLFTYFSPFGGPSSTAIDLASVELDTLAEASNWAYAFASLNVETNPLRNPATIGSGNPLNNSRVFLKRGFITIGNLDKSPFYLSAGQEYVPFGRYSSYMLSNPDTISEGRVNARTAVLGFYKSGLYLSTYALNGAANTESGFDAHHVYEWGANGGYKYSWVDNKLTGQFGLGFINNIAEAQGYQLNGLGQGFFQGFSARPDTEALQHPVPGFDAHASAAFGPINLVSEFVAATRAYSPLDLTFNNQGAEPKALHTELDYTLKNVFNTQKNVAIFLAYDHAWESLALNIPQNSYIAGLSTSIWKNTIEALEYRHDTNYASTDTASGICDPTGSGDTTCPVPFFGSKQNQLMLQIGAYF